MVRIVLLDMLLSVVICRQLKRDLRRAKFWVALLAFVVIHVTAFVVILRGYPEWRPIWFILIAPIEWPLIGIAGAKYRRN